MYGGEKDKSQENPEKLLQQSLFTLKNISNLCRYNNRTSEAPHKFVTLPRCHLHRKSISVLYLATIAAS